MRTKLLRLCPIATALVVAVATGGCDSAPPVTDQAASFLQDETSGEPVSIADAVASLSETQSDPQSDPPNDSKTHSVEGVIYAGDLEPFQPGLAKFVLSELPDPDHGDGTIGHLSECAFCRNRSEKKTKALVEFRDEAGTLIKQTASDLLGVAKGDHVIVTGECSYDEVADMLTIKAASLATGASKSES